MQYALQVFKTDDEFEFRTFEVDGEPWFSLADACRSLDIKNASDAANRLDDDEKGVVQTDTLGGAQKIRIINESGLWNLVLRSDKPEAKRFKKWVTKTVLPQIRKTGSFGSAGTPLFLKRYSINHSRVAPGHFSVIQVLATHLYGPMEFSGHMIAEKSANGTEIRPENSVGTKFSTWLKKHHPSEKDNYSYYLHWTPQAEFPARQYPNSMYGLFVEFLETVWIPECTDYWRTRDPAVLPHLPKLLPSNDHSGGMIDLGSRKRMKR